MHFIKRQSSSSFPLRSTAIPAEMAAVATKLNTIPHGGQVQSHTQTGFPNWCQSRFSSDFIKGLEWEKCLTASQHTQEFTTPNRITVQNSVLIFQHITRYIDQITQCFGGTKERLNRTKCFNRKIAQIDILTDISVLGSQTQFAVLRIEYETELI